MVPDGASSTVLLSAYRAGGKVRAHTESAPRKGVGALPGRGRIGPRDVLGAAWFCRLPLPAAPSPQLRGFAAGSWDFVRIRCGVVAEVSIVVPCYLEESHLRQSVAELLEIMDASRWDYEVIFVNDCSTDGTGAVLDEILSAHPGHQLSKLEHAHNRGRGAAVATGAQAATGAIIGFIDIDLEVHARYIPSLVLAAQNDADIVIAERIYKIRPSLLYRAALSKGYRYLVNVVLGAELPDTEAGFKFFKREVLLRLLPEIEDEGWFWDTEVVARGAAHGYRVATVPTLFLRRSDKESTVDVWRDTADYLVKLVRFRRRQRRGR
jgi:glycosyltransferase involved in cell wall biosynthesis